MKNQKNPPSSRLNWSLSDNTSTLKSGDDILLELNDEKPGRASFILEAENYVIRNAGLWNAKTIIDKEGKQVLVFKRQFLSNKGKVEFDNGKVYSCKFKDSDPVKLSFLTKDKKEVLSYKWKAKQNAKKVFNVSEDSTSREDLLMLCVLGYYVFNGVVNENKVVKVLKPVKEKNS